MKRRWLVLTATLAGFEVASAQNYPRTRDSSGVKIVENAARVSAPVRFVLSDKPVYEVGGLEDDPAKEFDHKQGYLRGVVLSNGGLAVIDVNRVHIFDAKGTRKLISGREGSGPGEFLYLTSLCRTRGDTIVVSDNRNRRVTLLDRDGSFIRALPAIDGSSPPFDGCLNDGTFLRSTIVRIPGPSNTISRVLYAVSRYRLDGTLADSLGAFDYGGADAASGRNPQVFAGANRMGFADGHGDILVRSFTPNSMMIVRSADPVEPISDADREARIRMTIPQGVSPDEARKRIDDRLRTMSSDRNWPSHNNVHIDDDGRLWVEDFKQDYRAAHGWTAFDPSGRLIGRLLVPATTGRFDIIAFGRNQAVFSRRDDEGAKYITVYAIKPVGGK